MIRTKKRYAKYIDYAHMYAPNTLSPTNIMKHEAFVGSNSKGRAIFSEDNQF
jgi:hypothetical protein